LCSVLTTGLSAIKKNELFFLFIYSKTSLDKKDPEIVKEDHSFVMRVYWNLKRGYKREKRGKIWLKRNY